MAFDNPYEYARATMSRTMTDREASIYLDACVANWDIIKATLNESKED